MEADSSLPNSGQLRGSRWDKTVPQNPLVIASQIAAQINATAGFPQKTPAQTTVSATGISFPWTSPQTTVTSNATISPMTHYPFVEEIGINDCPNKSFLLKQFCQIQISEATGVHLSAKGEYIPPYEQAGDRQSLCLVVKSHSQQNLARAVQLIDDIIRLDRDPDERVFLDIDAKSRFYARIPIGIESRDGRFPFGDKLFGPNGSFLRHMMTASGCHVTPLGYNSGVHARAIYVQNFPEDWSETDLKAFFEKSIGPVLAVKKIPTQHGPAAFVDFFACEHAQTAIAFWDGRLLVGKKVVRISAPLKKSTDNPHHALHLVIKGHDQKSMDMAKAMCQSLIDTVKKEYESFVASLPSEPTPSFAVLSTASQPTLTNVPWIQPMSSTQPSFGPYLHTYPASTYYYYPTQTMCHSDASAMHLQYHHQPSFISPSVPTPNCLQTHDQHEKKPADGSENNVQGGLKRVLPAGFMTPPEKRVCAEGTCDFVDGVAQPPAPTLDMKPTPSLVDFLVEVVPTSTTTDSERSQNSLNLIKDENEIKIEKGQETGSEQQVSGDSVELHTEEQEQEDFVFDLNETE